MNWMITLGGVCLHVALFGVCLLKLYEVHWVRMRILKTDNNIRSANI